VAAQPATLPSSPAEAPLDLFLLAPRPEQTDIVVPEPEGEEELEEAAFVAAPAPHPLEIYLAGRDYEREREGAPTVRI
jgi:hypothetical protein